MSGRCGGLDEPQSGFSGRGASAATSGLAPTSRPRSEETGAFDWGVGCVVLLAATAIALAVVLVRGVSRGGAPHPAPDPGARRTSPDEAEGRPAGWSRRVRRALQHRERELRAEIERARAELERLRLEAATSPDPAWRRAIAAKEAELAELSIDLEETRRKLRR